MSKNNVVDLAEYKALKQADNQTDNQADLKTLLKALADHLNATEINVKVVSYDISNAKITGTIKTED